MKLLENTAGKLVQKIVKRNVVSRLVDSTTKTADVLFNPLATNYHERIIIPPSIRGRKVWLFTPEGKLCGQVDYITARRLRGKRSFRLNIKEPKFPMLDITSLIPLLVTLVVIVGIMRGFSKADEE